MSTAKNVWVVFGLLALTISTTPAFAQVVAPASTPLQQQLGNFVAVPIGTTDGPNGQQQLEFRFNLPVVFTNPQVPTDFTGPGGSLGRAQGLRERILGPDRNTLPDSKGLIAARDPRYNFTGRWSPLSAQQVAVLSTPVVRTQAAVTTPPVVQTQAAAITSPALGRQAAVVTAPRLMTTDTVGTAPRVLTRSAVIPRTVLGSEALDQAQVMPTAGASYSVSAQDEITLQSGALLVKGGTAPLYVLMPLSGDTAVVKVEEGSLAMISNMDGRVSVANLHDSRTDSVVMYLTDRARQTYGEMPVRIGYMVETYPNGIAAGEHRVVAHTVLNQLRLSNGYSVETTRLSYPRTLKRFNITRALSESDLSRLIKTAAAVSYMDREREWNGLTPYAQ